VRYQQEHRARRRFFQIFQHRIRGLLRNLFRRMDDRDAQAGAMGLDVDESGQCTDLVDFYDDAGFLFFFVALHHPPPVTPNFARWLPVR
jgi:hypothetical protein